MSMSSSRPAQFLRGCVLVVGMALAEPAAAQLFFDWGGQEKVNDSGRVFVRIDAPSKPGEIIVSFSDRKLYYMTAPGMAVSYPIAIPREQDRWQGQTSVTQKRENPSWTPTPTMIKENPKLPRWVPGGHPLNPLGNRALYLGSSFYRIHGTDAPWTIGSAVSKGCIRMYNKDALDVYERAKVGAKVIVTWTAYKVTPVEGQANVADQQPASESRSSSGSSQSANSAAQPASATSSSTARPARNANVGRIYDSSGAEDFSARRSRRQAETEPDFAAPPQASSADDSDRPARPASSQQQASPQPNQQQRGDRSNRPRNATDQAANQQRGAGQSSTSRRTPAAAAPESASGIETGAIGREVAAAPVEPVATAAPVTEPSRPAARTAPARQPAQAQAAPAVAPAAASASDDLATRALQAAERAAAAAERAAAAAERAERAVRAPAPAAPAAPAAAD